MFGLNSFFSAGHAAQSVDRLFERASVAKDASANRALFDRSNRDWGESVAPTGFQGTNSASDRAMARIIEILFNVEHGKAEGNQPKVNETGGYILDATGTDGDDKIDLMAISAYNVDSGSGDDTLTIKAANLAGLDAGDGNDKINLVARYMSLIDGGSGDDSLQMSGKLAHDISGGDGNDTLKISANTILNVDGGAGNDTIYLEGERIFAAGGVGDDRITIQNKGEKPSELRFSKGDGQDIVNTNGPINEWFRCGRNIWTDFGHVLRELRTLGRAMPVGTIWANC